MIFRNWVLQNFPFLEDDFDALTDYELFCKMMEYVKKFAKDNEDFGKRLTDLENYVNNYFDNLDVQEEINNKLDEMAEDGTLENIISQYIELSTTYIYNTVSDMKQATNLLNGCVARTNGYYNFNDGGGAYYRIRNITNEDIVDEMFIIALYDNTLVAELIIENNELNIKQCGITGDIEDDQTYDIMSIFSKGYNMYFPAGTYNINQKITLTSHSIRGDIDNNSTLKYIGENNSIMIESNSINKLDIKNMVFDCGEATDAPKNAITLYNTIDLTIKNCEIKNGYGAQFRLNGSNNVLIENCYFHDITGTTGGVGNCIYCHPVKNLTVTKCRCSHVMEDFIYLDGEANTETERVENVNINNCYIKDIGWNNTLGTSPNGIGINGWCKNIFISDNIIIDGTNGVKVDVRNEGKPESIFINNNKITNNSVNGLRLNGKDIFVNNNIIINNGQDGIIMNGGININISNNNIGNNTRSGIRGASSNNIKINNCDIYNNTHSGILIGRNQAEACSNILVTNSTLYVVDDGTQTTGIQFLYDDNVKLINVDVSGSTINYDVQRPNVTNFVSQLNPNKGDNGTPHNITYNSAIPVDGTYRQGDIILYNSPTAGGHIGAICVSAGTPGTWKEFGSISA